MKRFAIFAPVIAALLAASCASAPPKVEKPKMTKENTVEIIDDMYHKTREVPDWIFLDASEINKSSEYKDFYVFKSSQTGKDIDGLKLWVRGFLVSSDMARVVSTRVKDTFTGAAAGDKDKLESYMEEVVKSVSESQFSGARAKMEYWWQIRKANADGSIADTYEYHVLYTIDKKQVDDAIRRALDEAANRVKPVTKDEQTARDRVKKAMEDEGL